MIRVVAVASVLICLGQAASAAARCEQPYAPDVQPDGKATKQKILNMRDDTQSFIAASDIYQACLVKAQSQDSKSKILANQTEKERVGKAFNAALAAYKKTQQAGASDTDLALR